MRTRTRDSSPKGRRRALALFAGLLTSLLVLPFVATRPAVLAAQESADEAPKEEKGMLSLKDGRIFVDFVLRKGKDGSVVVVLQNGTIEVPAKMVQDYFIPGEALVMEAKTPEEKEKLERGFVRFRGKWVREAVAKRKLQKEQDDRERQLLQMKVSKKLRNIQTVETRDFKFKHNLPEHLAEELIMLFEEFHDEWKKRWRKKLDLKRKPTVSFYADAQDYYQYTGISRGALGFYHFGGITLHMYWDRSDPSLTRNVLYHEATHLLTDGIDGDFKYPPWIEEGLAEYYGSSTWDPEARPGKRMVPGGILPGRLVTVKSMIKDKKPMKLEKLISFDRVSNTGFGAVEYAWAWTLMRFIHEDSKYEKRFKKYWLDLAHKRSKIDRVMFGGEWQTVSAEVAKDLFMKYMKIKDLNEFEKEWYAYIDKLEVDSLAGLEAAGRRFKAFGEHKEAKKVLKEAIDKGAKNALTWLAWADYQQSDGDYGAALKSIETGLELDPMLSALWYERGWTKRRMLGEENKAEGLKYLRIAAELDPYAYAWEVAEAETEDARRKRKNEKGD